MCENEFMPERNPLGKKLFTIIFFLILLLIPLFCVQNTIENRQTFRNDAVEQVAASWAKEQTIMAPELELKNGEYLNLSDYNIEAKVKTEFRKKGIFKIPVYTADITTKGTFLNPKYKSIDGTLIMNVRDCSGIVAVQNRKVNNINNSGSVKLNNAPKVIPFESKYTLRGLNSISFQTGGVNNNISISGNWKDPSFEGDFLPTERKVSKNGFSANWKLSGCFYSAAQQKQCTIMFLTPVDSYRMTIRTIKYGFLFLSLTFLAFFLFESASKIKPIHPFQYSLIGFSMIIFYMLLLSLSEFISFGIAYFIAVIMTIGLITGYTYFVLTEKDKSLSKTIMSILTILYLYLYTVLNLQDYALLLGSLGLFISMVAIMYYTKNINWYKD